MFSQSCISAGIKVLRQEAQALLDLIPAIDENFVKACQIMMNTKGKVILTGVGKSGHIASKIASTLASTGTQSFFVQASASPMASSAVELEVGARLRGHASFST